jgi:hypothetical protein
MRANNGKKTTTTRPVPVESRNPVSADEQTIKCYIKLNFFFRLSETFVLLFWQRNQKEKKIIKVLSLFLGACL